MENLFGNVSTPDVIFFAILVLQPFVILFQLLSSSVRWAEYQRSKSLKRRLFTYWMLVLFYIASIPTCLFLKFSNDDALIFIYCSYWLIWAYYCTHISPCQQEKDHGNRPKMMAIQ